MKSVFVLLFLSASAFAGEREDLDRIERVRNEGAEIESAMFQRHQANDPDFGKSQALQGEFASRVDDFKAKYGKHVYCKKVYATSYECGTDAAKFKEKPNKFCQTVVTEEGYKFKCPGETKLRDN